MLKVFASLMLVCATSLNAGENLDELAKESEAYCAVTAKDKDNLTPQMIKDKVTKAAELVKADGPAAFRKFKGKGSEFLFCGTYIWIHDINGVMKMHPIKHKMEGKSLLQLKDRKGKMIFVEMNKVASEKGDGWVEYVWPKPGQKEVSVKTSYVKLVEHNRTKYILGCGAYDLTLEDVKKSLGK